MLEYILALDQGTTSSRAILFDRSARNVAMAQQEFKQHFPRSGWVEHDPEDIWATTLSTAREALAKAGVESGQVAAIGIANQRETVVIWERSTGQPVHRAIVWQDRRTAEACSMLKAEGIEDSVQAKTGLLLDPYFSATKIAWILDNLDGVREAAEYGELAFGTIDTYLLWRLTGGRVHATDATNASRTLLYDIRRGEWSDELLRLFRVPRALLPEVRDCAASFGETLPGIFGGNISVAGIAGDQQAATIGQACFLPGMMKSTYGTGCFALLNTGEDLVPSRNRLLTTIAYQLGGRVTYALEGSIFVAGAAVQWLRDGLQIIDTAAQSGELAAAANPEERIYLVPAFVGLGAPHWNSECRGAIYGLTRATTRRELARAALDSVCFQTHDLLEAMQGDWKRTDQMVLRVDGGMVASDWTMQRLADLLNAEVDRPKIPETTALGAAYLAGLQKDLYPAPKDFAKMWQRERRFSSSMNQQDRKCLLDGWKDAVHRTIAPTVCSR